MNSTKDIIYNDLFAEIEKLYLGNSYLEIVNIKEARHDVDFLDSTKKHYCEFAIAFANSYIELDIFEKAIVIIDEYLRYLFDKGIVSEEDLEELSIFFLMKIEIYEIQGSILKQYRYIIWYIDLGGKDKQILEWKLDVEEALFMKYVKINKILLYILVGIIIISIVSTLITGKAFLSNLTTIGVVWYLLNYIFHKKTKQLFLHILKQFCRRKTNHQFSNQGI